MPGRDHPEVAVIIPTLALRERAGLLTRAIDSVIGQQGVASVPVVVVNGDRFDADLVGALVATPGLTLIKVEPADLPGALRIGRSAIRTPWFATLDDDDVLLPHALAVRREALLNEPAADVVVSNGYRSDGSGTVLFQPDMAAVGHDPIGCLAHGNWLLPGSWLARTERVGPDLFDGMPRYLECTFLAIQFALRYRTIFLQEPTVHWDAATPGGEHLTDAAVLAQPAALQQLLSLDIPSQLRSTLRRNLAAAYHAAANHYLEHGDVRAAWRQHVRTLRLPHGRRHWPLSLKILLRAARTT
jgi:hypothetical protein